MQLLVVMAAVLGLMEAEPPCNDECGIRAKQMVVEACGEARTINTSECAGRCYLKHDVYRISKEAQRQTVCRGEWLEKTASFDCPGGGGSQRVTYPEATRCTCSTCHPASTECDKRLAANDLQNCLLT